MKRKVKKIIEYSRTYKDILYSWLVKKKLPDFLIIGAMKSGTTSLYQYLSPHPQIVGTTEKEPSYFSWKYAYGIKEYFSKLPNRKDVKGKFLFEASATYLHHREAAKRIKKMIPDVNLITILRDPIERAISHYYYYSNPESDFAENKENKLETRSLEDAFLDDIHRKTTNWNRQYCRFSLYGNQLEKFYKYFNPNNILILDFDELKKDPLSVLFKISTFLNIDTAFFSEYQLTKKRVQSKRSFKQNKKKEIKIFNAQNYMIRPSEKLKNELLEFFHDDVKKLIDLTGMNFYWSEKYL